MAGVFDSITIIVPALFALGLAGAVAYERFRSGPAADDAGRRPDAGDAAARTTTA